MKVHPTNRFFSKCSLLLPLFFLLISSFLQAQTWTTQNEAPSGSLVDADFTSSTTGFILSESSPSIYRTTNDGASFDALDVPSGTTTLHSLWFPDANTGFAVGNDGVAIKTTDAGDSWSSLSTGTSFYLKEVCFVDVNTGWAAGDNGTIVKTTNGGATWTSQTTGTNPIFDGLFFVDANNGWIGDFLGNIYRTSNGGTTWVLQTTVSTTGWISDIWFVNSTTGWAITLDRRLLRTTNGGTTWTETDLSSFAPTEYFFSVNFTDASTGWVSGSGGVMLKSTDGGATWAAQSPATGNWLYCVFPVDANKVWATAHGGVIVKSTDGGANWTNLNNGLALRRRIVFTDANTGYTTGDDGKIWKTTNAGDDWDEISIPGTGVFLNLHFPSATNGWAVGDNGAILTTADAGENWTTQTSSATGRLRGVQFINATTGIFAGEFGQIFKTINSGATWVQKTSGTANWLFDVENSGTKVWVVGDLGTILKSTNSGNTWVAQTSGTANRLYDCEFVSALVGYACGAGGTLLKTSDGGTNWATLATGTTETIYDIHLFDGNKLVIAGFAGTVLRSTDGGATWASLNPPVTPNFFGVHFVSPYRGWVVGSNGYILRYDEPFCDVPVVNNVVNTSTTSTIYLTPAYQGIKYQLRYRLSGTTEWTTLPATASTTIAISWLHFDRTYDFEVRTQCPAGYTAYSQTYYFVTDPAPACTRPLILSATPAQNSIDVVWSSVPNLTAITLGWRKTGVTAWTSFTPSPTATMHTISGLLAGSQYQIRIRGKCGSTFSPYSLTTFTTTLPFANADDRDGSTEFGMEISPNPATEKLQISLDFEPAEDLKIVDLTGAVRLMVLKNENLSEISVAHLPAGVFFVLAKNQNGERLVRRFVKI